MMADQTPDYEALFRQAEERRQQAEEVLQHEAERRQQAEERRQQAEEVLQHEAERRQQAEERRQQAEEVLQHEAERRQQAEERTQATDLKQYIRVCHLLLSQPLRVGYPASSTRGKIPVPSGKLCPTRLCEWTDFEAEQRQIYAIVLRHLQDQRTFSSVLVLEDLGQRLSKRRLSSEKDLERWLCRAVDEHVKDIVRALCKAPAARAELNLSDSIRFDNHLNDIHNNDNQGHRSRIQPLGQADQYCLYRAEGEANALLLTVECKPPHKLSVETLCAGLRPMEFWQDVVEIETVPTDETEKLAYNAAVLVGSAIVQEYHVMIQEGLAYSYLSTGQAFVFLHVPETEPSTLYYYLCVPNKDVDASGLDYGSEPVTAIARVLCLCLMSCNKTPRDHSWRYAAISRLHTWVTSFDYARDQIPESESGKTPPGSEYIPSSPPSPCSPDTSVIRRKPLQRGCKDASRINPDLSESGKTPPGSEDIPSSPLSSPPSSPDASVKRRKPLQRGCKDASTINPDLSESSGSDSDSPSTSRPGRGRKRNLSAIAPAPSPIRSAPGRGNTPLEQGRQRRPINEFCTLKCLSGLKSGGTLDNNCPNVMEHRQGQDVAHHLINAPTVVGLLQEQLDKDLDHLCAPYGQRGAFSVPFKITLASYGYTVIGKGTTSKRWEEEISREPAVYQYLSSVQGSVVPVFLGSLDLARPYILWGAGLMHFLLMAWGGKMLTQQDMSDRSKEVARCRAKLRQRGVRHDDWRPPNLLWNAEVGRILAIDFHRVKISTIHPRVRELKKTSGSNNRSVNAADSYQRRNLGA